MRLNPTSVNNLENSIQSFSCWILRANKDESLLFRTGALYSLPSSDMILVYLFFRTSYYILVFKIFIFGSYLHIFEINFFSLLMDIIMSLFCIISLNKLFISSSLIYSINSKDSTLLVRDGTL